MALVAGLMALLVGAVVVAAVLSAMTGESDPAQERAALLGYVETIGPGAERAGKAVVQGVRPDVAQFRAGTISAEVWMADMDSYAKEFEAARTLLAGTEPPPSARAAQGWFEKAFRVYAEALAVLRSAGTVTGDQREQLISRGTQLGDEGDDLYDSGARIIQEALRRLGLPPDARLPGATG